MGAGFLVCCPGLLDMPGQVLVYSVKQLVLRMTDLTRATPAVDWINVDKLDATVNRVPERSDIEPLVNEQLNVELYSR